MAWKRLYPPSKVEPFVSRILGWKMVLLLPDVTSSCREEQTSPFDKYVGGGFVLGSRDQMAALLLPQRWERP